MPEIKTAYSLHLPREFVQQALNLKPNWNHLSDEAFLALYIAQGDFSAYTQKLKEMASAVQAACEKLGLPVAESKKPKSKPPAHSKTAPFAPAAKPIAIKPPAETR